jgi:DNA-directed RNA polymerase specialized sigma24 family protein
MKREEMVAEVYRLRRPILLTLSFRILRRRELAEDAVQSAFLKVLRNSTRFKDLQHCLAYICKACESVSIDIVRRRTLRRRNAYRVGMALPQDQPVVAEDSGRSRPDLPPRVSSALVRLVREVCRKRGVPAELILDPRHGLTTRYARRLSVPLSTLRSRREAALREVRERLAGKRLTG